MGGRGPCRVVAGQDVFEKVGRRGGPNGLWPDEAVGVAVPDDLQMKVVCDLSAGQHGVQVLPGLVSGGEAVHGVHRDALCGVHGGGVAQRRARLYVGGWQSHPVSVATMLDVKITTGVDGDYGPAVAVFDPVGRCQPELAVVAAGNDQLADAGPVPIGQGYLQVDAGRGVGESVAAGFPVEFGNEVPGGREHDRIEALGAIVLPGGEHLFGDGGEVADVYSLVVEVDPDGFGLA